MERWASFDCYGTLIDWDGGVRAELARVFGEEQADELLARYHELEPELQRDGTLQLPRGADASRCAGSGAPAGEEDGLAESLPAWRAFPEVHGALAEAAEPRLEARRSSPTPTTTSSRRRRCSIGVPFDEVVVAQEIGSYKPGTSPLGRVLRAHARAARGPRARRRIAVPRHRALRTSSACAASGSTGSARQRRPRPTRGAARSAWPCRTRSTSSCRVTGPRARSRERREPLRAGARTAGR